MATNSLDQTHMQSNTVRRFLERVWRAGGLGAAFAVGLAGLGGLAIGYFMPHGPATASQALLVMLVSLVIGAGAGVLMRSSWALLVAPLAYVLAVEWIRRGAVGPTVDLPRLDETFGILALILGRGFHGLVGLLPMIIGAGVGVRVARRLSEDAAGATRTSRRMHSLGAWLLGLGVVVLLALAILMALPASTPPILGSDGQPLAGSVAELVMAPIGGQKQALLIRGESEDNPVLLYLAGGPGQSDLPHPRAIFQDLERDFIVVSWDQRGTGKSYAALDPISDLTPEQAVADTIDVTNYLRERFSEEKIYLLGESWGTILGVLAVQQRPDLFHAYIGSGQMVNVAETDRGIYHDVIAYAGQTGNKALAETMQGFGEPPYSDIPYANAFVMGQYDNLYAPYTPPAAYVERGEAANLGPMGMLGSEYNLVEKANVLRGLIDMFSVMYPQIQDIDFRRDATSLDVPVYILDGKAELAARRDLALEWFGLLQAPRKQLFAFDNAAHAVAFEQFEAFHRILNETILPETYPGR